MRPTRTHLRFAALAGAVAVALTSPVTAATAAPSGSATPSALAAPSSGQKPPSSSTPKAAQSTAAAPTDNVLYAPPPVDMSKLPTAEQPHPPQQYQQKTACIGSPDDLPNIVSKPWGQLQLRIDEAHRFATGKGIKVGVIDTGVNPRARFGGRVTQLGDFVQANPNPNDCDGHGTEVAGIIGAQADPDSGFVGVAPDAQILAIRQSSANFKDSNDYSPGDVGTLARAVVWEVQNGAQVINISVTSCNPPSDKGMSEGDLALQAALHWAVNDKNVVVVAAAGNVDQSGCKSQNDQLDPTKPKVIADPPWFADDVLSVAAINRQGDPATFTAWGPWVSVAAPGTEIITLDPSRDSLANAQKNQNGQLEGLQGTSFASPYVAGLAALIRERFPTLSARQVMQRIEQTAQHPGNPSGRDYKIGYGMVNPVAALTAVLPAEQGKQSGPAKPIFTDPNPLATKDWTPMVVALSGTGIGVGLLLITLFVVHTVNRTRARQSARR